MYPDMTTESEILGVKVLATLGFGARSSIFAVADSNNNRFALKRIIRNENEDQRFIDQAIVEHEVAKRFCHPNLRRSFKLIRKRSFIRTQQVIVLMELVEGHPLDQCDPKSMMEMVNICKQIALALGEMHAGGYVHCDIKPNNIIYTREKIVKVIDFGQSCPIGTIKERIQGTPDYIAPEQVKRKQITPRTDVFNLGATLYWMLTGKHVPTLIGKHSKGKAGSEALVDVSSFVPPRELNPQVPPALSSLVVDCVETDPYRRPESMTVVYDRLSMAMGQVQREEDQASPATADEGSPSTPGAGSASNQKATGRGRSSTGKSSSSRHPKPDPADHASSGGDPAKVG